MQDKIYTSPFPRKATNAEVLKMSRTVNNNLLDIPPTLTKSYMRKNPLYFDIKSKVKNATSSNSNISSVLKSSPISLQMEKVDLLLQTNCAKLLAMNRVLSPGKEKIIVKQNKKQNLTKRQIADEIYNAKHRPQKHKKFGQVPD